MTIQRADSKNVWGACSKKVNNRNCYPMLTAICLFLACGCASIPTKTVDLAALNRLKEDGVTQTDVTRLLGKPFKARGTQVTTTDKNAPVFYMLRIRERAADYRGRAPLDEEARKRGYFGVSFKFDPNQRVREVGAMPGGGKLDEAPVRRFKTGVTTKAQVYDAYGYPDVIRRSPDGSLFISYNWFKLNQLVENTANDMFEGRRYLRSQTQEQQAIQITFDNKGVALKIEDLSGTIKTYYFTSYPPSRSDAPFDEKSLVKAKLNRMSLQEVDKLFGSPEVVISYPEGQQDYSYGRHWGEEMLNYSGSATRESNDQTLQVTFGPDQMTTSVMFTGSSLKYLGTDRHQSENLVRLGLALEKLAVGSPFPFPSPVMPTIKFETSMTGTKVDTKLTESIETGKSTPQDIVKLIGVPDGVIWNKDGSTIYSYRYYSNGSDNEYVRIEFDSDGHLKETTRENTKFRAGLFPF